MKLKTLILTVLLFTALTVTGSDLNITNFGARNDTTVLSTKAIQKAIDQCAQEGGGRVIIPAGNFVIGSLFLRSNVCLWLESGANLYGSTNIDDYTAVKPEYISLRTHVPTLQLIYAEKCNNVSIAGYGTIDGRGISFKKKIIDGHDEGIFRPHLLRFVSCDNITISDVNLRNSACWMQHFLACDRVIIRGIRVFNRNNHNNDGIDLDGCHDVVVTGCIIDSDDDGIVLKSTSPRLCENINITGCIVSSHCNALKLGTESNGGFRNISISDCIVKPSYDQSSHYYGLKNGISAISIEEVDGGILENVNVNNINVTGTESPIFVRLGKRNRPYDETIPVTTTGVLQNVHISNIFVNNAGSTGCSISGVEGMPVADIILRNIYISMAGGVNHNIPLPTNEYENGYPEATIWGTLPASGFMLRHTRNVILDNVNITTLNPDVRPSFIYDDAL